MSATLRSLDGQNETAILREIQSALHGLRLDVVEIIVYNGQVVQIECGEKLRLQQPVVEQARSTRPDWTTGGISPQASV